ncbi:hypothetical protein KTAU_43340 [Thermogemmatispora aurantia]|uniref:KOW domain-containing protein n=1 Tax=Thermogemmatispora aurantia TaxID=2045279 RepID=A0A5J4KHC4_9CHLR|nr:hypothetical protein [Thermogemmatispora aurantia]GER85700.1 hypothetical protein KTAU_43340 [Thermogemmatispora aurantia]
MAYPLGWSVRLQVVVRRERWPGGSRGGAVALVYPGQMVEPDQPVIRLKREERGEELGGLLRLSLPAVTRKLPAIHPTSAHHLSDTQTALAVPALGEETVPAGLRGRVVDVTARGGVVIESPVVAIQGVLGAGPQVAGVLTLWQALGNGGSRSVQPIPPGAILVVPGPLSFLLLRHALNSGVVGIIASSIFLRDLEGFLHADLLELVNSPGGEDLQSRLPPLTIMLTEGLGSLAMPARLLQLLSCYQGRVALLSGFTSVRRHALPELLISLTAAEAEALPRQEPDLALVPGARVRVCSGDYCGRTGEVLSLFLHRQRLPSGVRAQAARVLLEEGEVIVAALSCLDRIG